MNPSLTDSSRPYVLITGATGLVGQYLLKDLLGQQQRLATLVRPGKRHTAIERMEAIMQRWEREMSVDLPRPIVLEGDISNGHLNLTNEHQSWVRTHCSRIIHNAAILQFNGPNRNGEPWITNLEGTRHVIDFADKHDIAEFHYVSTAYVSGISDSVVYENDFDRGQDFRNDYERSKFEAEKLVHTTDAFASKTIYRPAVIAGDSKTGFTSTYHGLFLYLRLLATLVPEQQRDSNGIRQTPIRLPMTGDEPRNVVPVDWVSRLITEIFCNPKAHGRTFHLVPKKFTTARQVIEYCYEYFNSAGVQFCSINEDRQNDSEFAAKFFENARVYESYEKSDPMFDFQNVKQFCRNVDCPEMDKETILRFLDFGIKDNWGKKKVVAPKNESWIERHMSHIQMAVSTLNGQLSRQQGIRFGVDAHGPGGGQWALTIKANAEVECRPGIPANFEQILQFDRDQIADETITFDSESPSDYWHQILVKFLEHHRLTHKIQSNC